MTPHGPDTTTYEAAVSDRAEQPSHLGRNTLAFMFETSLTPRVTPAALGSPCIDRDYYKCWVGLKSHFDREWHNKQQQQQPQQNGSKLQHQQQHVAGAAASAAVNGLAAKVDELALQVPECSSKSEASSEPVEAGALC